MCEAQVTPVRVGWRLGTTSEPCRNYWATEKSPPTMFHIAACKARDHGGPAIHLMAILDAAEELERLID